MAAQYKPAPEVEAIARGLIPEHHPHLAKAKITVLSGREKHLTGLDAVMEVNSQVWAALTPGQRQALVDHELCHVLGENGEFYSTGHDLEEFSAVVRRHGLWYPDVQGFAEAMRQVTLDDLVVEQELVPA